MAGQSGREKDIVLAWFEFVLELALYYHKYGTAQILFANFLILSLKSDYYGCKTHESRLLFCPQHAIGFLLWPPGGGSTRETQVTAGQFAQGLHMKP